MKKIIEKWYNELGFPKEWDTEFYSLLDRKELSPCRISEYDRTCADKEQNLLMHLFFCEELYAKYTECKIPMKIFLDTASDVVIWAKVHYEINASIGLSETNWLKHHFAMNIFRLGRLQFQFGDNELKIHIPAGEPMTPKKCLESISIAREFFEKFFPEFKYDKFTCNSWLLDDTLLQFIDNDSNIANFMRMFDIKTREESYAALKYILRHDATRENIKQFEKKSSLAKKVSEYVLSGGKLYQVLGEIRI